MRGRIALLLLLGACAAHAAGPTLRRVAAVDLPGPPGERFDYLTIDYEDHYLLSAHLGPGILYVLDTRTNRLVKAISGLPEITGLEYVPGLRKVYTSNRGETKVGVGLSLRPRNGTRSEGASRVCSVQRQPRVGGLRPGCASVDRERPNSDGS